MVAIKNTLRNGIISGIIISGISSCAVKPVAVYDDVNAKVVVPHIENVYALNIFTDYITSELWKTENSSCIQVENVFDSTMIGKGGLYLKWNKTSGGCDWIGLGIGWDGWSSKNIQEIYNEAAIQFMVRSPKGNQIGLPWAMAFEDYGGGQAWAGVFANYIEGGLITEQWTKVQIPLTAFDFNEFDADMTNIKQLVIQFESEGEIYFDDLRLVATQTVKSKLVDVPFVANKTNTVDGTKDDLFTGNGFQLSQGTVWLAVNDNTVMVYAEIDDKTPLQNNKTGVDIWNGDALEIAFSTNADAPKTRKNLLLSDQHIGIKSTTSPTIYNWRTTQNAKGNVVTQSSTNGYIIEAAIPMDQFIAAPFVAGNTYGIELAIDAGTTAKGREKQYRWNNPYNEGFNTSPQLWGQMLITNETVIK